MTKRLAFMLAVALGACAGSGGSGRVEYAAAVTVRSPQLLAIEHEPGVYVLADADEPVFYTDNYYWLYRSGRWYRSHSYDRDWVYVSSPSPRVRRIQQPMAYVRFSARTREARNVPPAERDTWRDDRERTDVPSTVPPHQQPPLQPTQPQQPQQPYPRPPQQESPVDHHIAPQPPAQPRTVPNRLDRPLPPPAQVDRTTPEKRAPGQDRGTDVKAPGHDRTPPGQDRGQDVKQPGHDRGRDTNAPGAQRPTTPPGQAKKTEAPPDQEKAQKDDARKQEKTDKKDKKRDY